MSQNFSADDQLRMETDPPKLTSTLNVLTILTFTWCAISALITVAMPAINDWLLSTMEKAKASGKDFSAKEIADMEKGKQAIELYKEHMIPLIVISIVCILLCFIGALWMRKLKKDGYWLYVAGELAPIAAGFIIMGSAQYAGIFSIFIGIAIPVVFVILYTTQRKYLVF